MRRSFLYVLVGVVLVAIAAFAALQSVQLDTWIFRMAVRHAVAAGNAKLAGTNELAVVLVGTGTPLPDVSRAGPSTLIAAGDHLDLVDAGVDSARNLQLWKVPLNRSTPSSSRICTPTISAGSPMFVCRPGSPAAKLR